MLKWKMRIVCVSVWLKLCMSSQTIQLTLYNINNNKKSTKTTKNTQVNKKWNIVYFLWFPLHCESNGFIQLVLLLNFNGKKHKFTQRERKI